MMDDNMHFLIFIYEDVISIYNVKETSIVYYPEFPLADKSIRKNICDHLNNNIRVYLKKDIHNGYHCSHDGPYGGPYGENLIAEIIVKLENREDLVVCGFIYYNGKEVYNTSTWKFRSAYIPDSSIVESVQMCAEHLSDVIKHQVMFNI